MSVSVTRKGGSNWISIFHTIIKYPLRAYRCYACYGNSGQQGEHGNCLHESVRTSDVIKVTAINSLVKSLRGDKGC